MFIEQANNFLQMIPLIINHNNRIIMQINVNYKYPLPPVYPICCFIFILLENVPSHDERKQGRRLRKICCLLVCVYLFYIGYVIHSVNISVVPFMIGIINSVVMIKYFIKSKRVYVFVHTKVLKYIIYYSLMINNVQTIRYKIQNETMLPVYDAYVH